MLILTEIGVAQPSAAPNFYCIPIDHLEMSVKWRDGLRDSVSVFKNQGNKGKKEWTGLEQNGVQFFHKTERMFRVLN